MALKYHYQYPYKVSNAKKYAYEQLGNKTREDLHAAKLIFGSRKGSDWHRASLKKELNIALGTKNRSYLRTDLGSRFGVNSFN